MGIPDDEAILLWGASLDPAEAEQGGARQDHLRDLLSTDRIGEAFRAAREAPEGPTGEAARRALRLRLPAFFVQAEGEIRAETLRLHREADGTRLLSEAARDPDPAARAAAVERWVRAAENLRDADGWGRDARDAAARGLGAADAWELLGATVGEDRVSLESEAARAAVEPLDEAVARAVAERWRRSPWRREGVVAPAAEDVPFLERLGDRATTVAVRTLDDVLESIREAFRRDGVGGSPASPRRSASGGPGGLRDGLEALGLELRGALRRECGAAPGSDPAFGWATTELFGRVARHGRGLASLLPPFHEDVRLDVQLETALAPRVAWALCHTGIPGTRDDAGRLSRATGRPPSPSRLLALGALPVDPSARLRGILLAVLLEERLLVRFGYRWWDNREARDLLRDLWSHESAETPRSVASALGLGTMEPSPLSDAYRP